MQVLLTRTTPFAEPIKQMCLQRGLRIQHYPLITIQPTLHQIPLQNAARNLSGYHIVIFMSQWAAHYAMPVINQVFASKYTYPNLLWTAIGPSTAKKLQDLSINSHHLSVLIPKTIPYESESFLALDDMQSKAIQNKKILIFRGDGGRELIPDTLQKRGAKLTIIEAYQRKAVNYDTWLTLFEHSGKLPDLIIITSAHALHHLTMLSSLDDTIIKKHNINTDIWNIPMIVVGKRLLETAKKLGFTRLIFATSADDQTLKDVMCENFSI